MATKQDRIAAAFDDDLLTAKREHNLSVLGIADALRTREKTLYAWMETRNRMPLWLIGEWSRVTGGTALVQEIARQAGGVYAPVFHSEDDEVDLVQTIRDFSRAMESLSHARKDGRITRDEAETFDELGHTAIGAIHALIERTHRDAAAPMRLKTLKEA